ncbi:MAG: Integral rane sensor signal transduction histidine kinase [Clostridia bacterium]|jgi:two-component system sensor histidine kinase YcbA|nr:Integral rane sensor signal transduction histidine kinase [Clostridia bacterium]
MLIVIGVVSLKSRIKKMLMVGLFTAFMGQVNFYPFRTDFRITVGVVMFTFLLLYFHSVPIVATSIITGISVLLMRVGIDVFANAISVDAAFYKHIPALLYYISYGIIIDRAGFRSLFEKPIYFIVALTTADIMSNFLELIVRNQSNIKSFDEIFSTIMLTAMIRSSLVLALFWIIKYYSLFITKEEHQKRYKELLLLTAKLKSEVFFLKKSMQDIEGAMVKSYSIYNTLKESDPISKEELEGLMADSLNLSIDIHEIKKDYNRIVISMEKLMPASDLYKTMKMSEIFETINDIFTRYLEVINKDVSLSFEIGTEFKTSEYFIIISILNNMIQNSIEACYRSDSYVKVMCFMQANIVVFNIEDNGKGIKEKDSELIFEPGFTTKFNPETGQISTGLGLTHIKMLLEYLNGNVSLDNNTEGITRFRLELPIDIIICEGDD